MHFNPENKFFSFMSLLGDLILLNLLFILTSIPVITFGASSSALYTAVKKRISGEESYIVRDYIKAWKENIKNCLCIWGTLLFFLAGMLIFTMYISAHLSNMPAIIVYSLLFTVLSFILIYVFPLQATFINSPFRIIINSLLTALKHLPWTFFMFFTVYAPPALTLLFPSAIYFTAAYWFLIGFSLSTVFTIFGTKKVFVFYIPEE